MEVVVEHSTSLFWKLMGARAVVEPQVEAEEAELSLHEMVGQNETGDESDAEFGFDDAEHLAGMDVEMARIEINAVEEEEEVVVCKVCKNERGRKIHHGSQHRGLETNQPELGVEQAAVASGIFGAVLNMFNN